MKYFPIQIVDNFFSDPDKIVDFANSLKFKKNKTGDWPGERTDYLHNIDKKFFNEFLSKVLSLNFDYKYHKITWENVELTFQKTKPLDPSNKNSILNEGLVHVDGDFPLVGLVYLTKDADPDSGTSIFELKKDCKPLNNTKTKRKIYSKHHNKLNNKDYNELKKLIKNDKDTFFETCRINNIYNRLFVYNGKDYHKANSFYTGTEERLTLVFFMKQINANSHFPLQRLKNYVHE